ncbi:hypothetical protein Dimus_025324 [Dionaea muscipula]
MAQAVVEGTFLAAAIRKCGRNVEKGKPVYTAYGSSGQLAVLSAFLGPDQLATELTGYRS